MRVLATIDRLKLVGMLADRLAFGRAAPARYDEVIEELRRAEPAVQRIVPRLEQQRADETASATWLQDRLHTLEAPVEQVRARGELVAVECVALFGDRGRSVFEMVRSLHRLGMADVEAWELMAKVAERGGDEPARKELSARRDEERGHMRFLERVLVVLAVNEVLGYPVSLPVSP